MTLLKRFEGRASSFDLLVQRTPSQTFILYSQRNFYDDISRPMALEERPVAGRVHELTTKWFLHHSVHQQGVAVIRTLGSQYAEPSIMRLIMSQQRMKAPPRPCRPPNLSSPPRPSP